MRPTFLPRAVPAVLFVVSVACGPTYPNCDHDEQCHEGEYCVGGHCSSCRDGADCPAGSACVSGACAPIAGWCASDAQCPASERCEAHRCMPTATAAPVESSASSSGPDRCALEPVYFAFDESTLDTAARSTIQADQACLVERGASRVSITGMTVPRGTEEYNLALSQRRAEVVRDHLRRTGFDPASVSTRSLGEESSRGVDESGWSRDRRAELAPR